MTRIKICGITNLEDAQNAVKLGVDALGFIFAKSKRQVTPEDAKDIIKDIPAWVSTVGVFVDEDIEKVKEIADYCNLCFIQLHGNESPEYCSKLKYKVIKTIKRDISKIPDYNVSTILLDTYDPKLAGGTGKVFDVSLAKEAKKYNKPIILAGGLNPDNVLDAIKEVEPYGVEGNSGVESSPGKKDFEKMMLFVERIKG